MGSVCRPQVRWGGQRGPWDSTRGPVHTQLLPAGGTASGAGRELRGHTALAPCQTQACTVCPSVLDPRLEAGPHRGPSRGPQRGSANRPFPTPTREGGGPQGSEWGWGAVGHRVRPAGAPPLSAGRHHRLGSAPLGHSCRVCFPGSPIPHPPGGAPVASVDSMTWLLPLRSSAQYPARTLTFSLSALEASPALCSYSNRAPPEHSRGISYI